MRLDDVPDPPELDTLDLGPTHGQTDTEPDQYRRAELAEYLNAGAWKDAWEAWVETTELTDDEYAIIHDLDLIREFDFFWDDFAGRVGYHAPGLPEDWRERDLHPDLDSWNTVSSINASLTELGQIVSDILLDDYIEWESAFEAPDDLPDFDT